MRGCRKGGGGGWALTQTFLCKLGWWGGRGKGVGGGGGGDLLQNFLRTPFLVMPQLSVLYFSAKQYADIHCQFPIFLQYTDKIPVFPCLQYADNFLNFPLLQYADNITVFHSYNMLITVFHSYSTLITIQLSIPQSTLIKFRFSIHSYSTLITFQFPIPTVCW